ncbi:UNVERIFIED_CONTAM: hypothetical protein K2H54_061850 [Gekko kuhli]
MSEEPTPWEDAKTFLASFEQVALVCRWPREKWVTLLLPALSGEVEQEFSSLRVQDTEDYGKVKVAILQAAAVAREKQRDGQVRVIRVDSLQQGGAQQGAQEEDVLLKRGAAFQYGEEGRELPSEERLEAKQITEPRRCMNKARLVRSDLYKEETNVSQNTHPCRCPGSFRNSTDLRMHDQTPTGEKPHKYSECGKIFCGSTKLVTHGRIPEGVTSYSVFQESFASGSKFPLGNQQEQEEHPLVDSHTPPQSFLPSTPAAPTEPKTAVLVSSSRRLGGKRRNSAVWEHFRMKEDPRLADCLLCRREVSRGKVMGHLTNSGMVHHLKTRHSSVLGMCTDFQASKKTKLKSPLCCVR